MVHGPVDWDIVQNDRGLLGLSLGFVRSVWLFRSAGRFRLSLKSKVAGMDSSVNAKAGDW